MTGSTPDGAEVRPALWRDIADLETLLENTDETTFLLDREYRYLVFSRSHAVSMKAIYGTDIEVGKRLFDFMTVVEDREKAKQNIDRALNGERVVEVAHSGDQSLRRTYVEIVHNPVRDEKGEVIAVAICGRDISERGRAEHALRESEERFRVAFDRALIGKCLTAPDGRLIRVNRSFCNMLGYAPQELMAETYETITHPEDQETSVGRVRRILAGEDDHSVFEKRYLAKDGRVVHAQVNAVLLRNAEGEPVHFITDVLDITERKRADAAQRENSAKLQIAIDEAPIGLAAVGLDKRFLSSNRAFCSFTGYSEEELRHKTIDDITHPEDVGLGKEELVAVAEGARRSAQVCKRYVRKDGAVVWGEVTINLVRNHKGEPQYFLPTIQDVTERKRAEEILRAQFENSPDIILVMDRDHKIERINHTAQGDLTVESLKGRDAIAMLPPESQVVARGLVERCFETGEAQEFEHTISDGTWVRARIVSLARGGETPRVMVISTNITERKRAEEERARLEAQLHHAQKMESVGRLAGGVAHDFNNMLGAILGHVELAIHQADPAHAIYADLEEIKAAAKRSADLTRQLLAFARKQTIAPRVLDLNKTVASMLNMLHRLIGEDIELAWLPGKDLWPVKVDPSQIDQILANLCVNACDAIAGVGRLTIETGNSTLDEDYCASHAEASPGDYVRLVVSDNGCGMDSQTKSRLFEPFFTTKAMGKGTGLGLATVYGIVRQNHGFICVSSQVGQGTTFTIYVPRYVGKADRFRKDAGAVPVHRGNETILLVEDELTLLKLGKRMLESFGYTVLAASTPGEAIRLAAEHVGEIHLLITDVVMPEMNGRDLARNVLALYPGIKRLFMSGYTANVIADRGVLHEGMNFIQKPFSIEGLAAKVREVLEQG